MSKRLKTEFMEDVIMHEEVLVNLVKVAINDEVWEEEQVGSLMKLFVTAKYLNQNNTISFLKKYKSLGICTVSYTHLTLPTNREV